MKSLLLVLVVCFTSTSYSAEDEHKALLANFHALQKELLPAKGTLRTDIERLWGTPKETHGEEIHTQSAGTKKLRRCCCLLIPHYWLWDSYDSEARCFNAYFAFDDPPVAWKGEGAKEAGSLEHAKQRLEFLERLKAKKQEGEKKDSNRSVEPMPTC